MESVSQWKIIMGGRPTAVFEAILVLFLGASADSVKYTPEKLANDLGVLNVSDWNVPFFVCVAQLTSNLSTDFKVETESDNFTGLFGLSDTFRRENGCFDLSDVSSEYACAEKIILNPNSIPKKTQGIKMMKIDFDSCVDYWRNLSKTSINSTSTETCNKSSGLAVNLLLAVVDVLLICLCFVLFLYVRDQKNR